MAEDDRSIEEPLGNAPCARVHHGCKPKVPRGELQNQTEGG